jgi:hypothetical protein
MTSRLLYQGSSPFTHCATSAGMLLWRLTSPKRGDRASQWRLPGTARRLSTRSMCMCAKRRWGTGISAGWRWTCLYTLPRWQNKPVLAMRVMALAIWGQQNRAVMSRRVARTPGWWMECSDWKTASLDWMSTSGRNSPVEASPSREAPPTACDVICRLPKLSISATSGQNCCCAATTEKSTDCASAMAAKTVCSQPLLRPILGDGGEGGRRRGRLWLCFGWRGRLRASVTTFSCPGVCLMSEVNSVIKDNCHCWQATRVAWWGTGLWPGVFGL